MITSPQYVKFENPVDIVDYVTRGLPPTREDFNALMTKIKLPDDWSTSLQKQGKEITVPQSVFTDWSEEEIDVLYKTLDRVYANRCRNLKITCGAVAGVVVAGLVIAIIT